MGKLFTGLMLIMCVQMQTANATDDVTGVTGLQAPSAAQATILVLGDSLSAAWGIDKQLGWVELLRHRLASAGHEIQLINGSISGETTSGGLNRLAPLLEQHQPEFVIIELGANDGLQGLPLDSMEANLNQMIDQAEAVHAQVLLAGMRIPPNLGPLYSKMFVEVYQRLAKNRKVIFIPFFLQDVAARPELTQPDGLHPNAAAQPIILENVWPYLERLIAAGNSSKEQEL